MTKKRPFLVAWQTLSSPQVTMAMGSLGFDWIVVDLEHASITTQEAESIFIASERCGCKPFVRLPSADPYLARRMLDAGAQGLLMPVVEERTHFDAFAQHCFYPPRGQRGLGLVRANLWGKNFDSYFKDFKPTLIAQIETVKGAENINDILASTFVDGVMVGPYDLSASLHKAGEFEDPEFIKLKNNILKAAKGHNKMTGCHQVIPDIKAFETAVKEDYDFVAYGTDIVALSHSLAEIKKYA